MSDTLDRVTVEEAVVEAVIKEFGFDADSWAITDEELESIFGEVEVTGYDIEDLLSECYRADTNTNRLIQRGFVCFGGAAYFANEEDAYQWVMEGSDFKYKNWAEVFAASERGEIDECYYTEWHH